MAILPQINVFRAIGQFRFIRPAPSPEPNVVMKIANVLATYAAIAAAVADR